MRFRLITFALLLLTISGAAQRSAKTVKPRLAIEKARSIALVHRPGTILKEDLESVDNRVVYTFQISAVNGTREVQVDANDGSIVHDWSLADAQRRRRKQKQTMK